MKKSVILAFVMICVYATAQENPELYCGYDPSENIIEDYSYSDFQKFSKNFMQYKDTRSSLDTIKASKPFSFNIVCAFICLIEMVCFISSHFFKNH